MSELSFLVPFSLGLFSTLHCLAMCGGIITALSMGLIAAPSGNTGYALVFNYNLGRIISYSIAGVMAGTAGMLFTQLTPEGSGHRILQIIAGLFLVMLGLHIGGWFPQFKKIEHISARAWQLLQPVGRLFIPVDHWFKALIVGSIWGWLPCGLVYSVLLWTVASADPIIGGSYMFAFGLGTLPGMVAAGILGERMRSILQKNRIKKVAGILILGYGVWSVFVNPVTLHSHEHSGSPSHQHMLH